MATLKNTGATLTAKTGDHTFNFSVYRDNVGFVVFLKQTTSFNNTEGLEDLEDCNIIYKCVCHYSKTEHSAIHLAGEKYIKNWNKKGRIGKDNMILN